MTTQTRTTMKFLKRLFCVHQYVFVRSLFGDQILFYGEGGRVRSLWRCAQCGKLIGRADLHEPNV